MAYVEEKYLGQLSFKLNRFKVVSNNPLRANFRCPICGDSQKSKSKARGWVIDYPDKGLVVYYCHNCGASMPFGKFLKEQDPNIYNDYIAEKFLSGKKRHKRRIIPKQPKPTRTKLQGVKNLLELEDSHPAKIYVRDRKIPLSAYQDIYYAPKFKKWINTFIPNKFTDLKYDEPRLIFPFLDKEKKLFGVNGRSFDPKGLRYITVMLPGDNPKIYGLDRVDMTREFYVTEGPIDSLFIDNAIAMAGADAHIDNPNAVFVMDNEPRSREITRRMRKLIQRGHKIFIWPKSITAKDINDWVIESGVTKPKIIETIKSNTYKGLEAELKLNHWAKN